MRKILMMIIVCWLSVMIEAQGQGIKFLSADVEKGIRQHLNIEDNEDISFLQLDTITSLDLSKRSIVDINDLVLLPNLRRLDLNNNMVEDLRPLSVLDSLEWVDLSYNNLKNINHLVYSNAKNMTVNLAYNYIGDFSLFGSITLCNFTLEGTGLQLNESASFFDVCQLHCDASIYPTVIRAKVQTNMTEVAKLMYADIQTDVPTNSDSFTHILQNEPTQTIPVYLNNGVKGDSTYLIPQTKFRLESNETVNFETGLPDDYTIRLCSFPQQGSITVDGVNLEYTASSTFEYEEIVFSYYWGPILKGFSKVCFLNKVLMGDVNMDGNTDISDVVAIVNYILGSEPNVFNRTAADLNKDNSIDISDVVRILNLILEQ